MRVLVALALAALCAGCVTSGEVVSFTPKPGQEALIRDGIPAVVSRQARSQVIVTPSARQIGVGTRPIFTVAIQNLTKAPVTFLAETVSVEQVVDGDAQPLKVFGYDELVNEEKQANTNRIILASVAGGLNSYSAGNSYWRQAHASNQNARLAGDVAAAHQQNMAHLEAAVIKSHTLMPGETHTGRIILAAPVGETSKSYIIRLKVGNETHEVAVTQKRIGGPV